VNRAVRRATVALHRAATKLPWQPFEQESEVGREDLFARQRERVGDLLSVWKNNLYIVQIYRRALGVRSFALHLAIRRIDERPIEGWDDLQRIKDELAGPERVAVEMYPARSELMDQANMRHLFVLPDGEPAPFSIRGRWA